MRRFPNSTILVIIICLLFVACKKEALNSPAIAAPQDDRRDVLLRDIVIQNLPSPYYHFEYDDHQFITGISFASNLFVYQLTYTSGRLSKMGNSFNGNELVYTYQSGNVNSIQEVSGFTGSRLWLYTFDYSSTNRLQEVRWYQFDAAGTDSMLFRKVIFVYHADGNLAAYDDYRNFGESLNLVQHVAFSDYDDGLNTDDFGLFKDFFENLLMLPRVRLQYNNPRNSIITGMFNDYAITYEYQYDSKNRPVSKRTDMHQTRGSDSGARNAYVTNYTYY